MGKLEVLFFSCDFKHKMQQRLKSAHKKNDSLFTWKRSYRIFSNFAHKLSRLSSLNPESFVAKCLTRFRDNGRYPKRSALRQRHYGTSCCLETNRNIKFDHRLKGWCSMMEIEATPCETLIWKDPPQCQKTVMGFLKREHRTTHLRRIKFVFT